MNDCKLLSVSHLKFHSVYALTKLFSSKVTFFAHLLKTKNLLNSQELRT